MSVIANNIVAGAAGQGGADAAFQIDRSLRFNSADSAYLNRTPSSAGNRTVYTWAFWVKRTGLGSYFIFRATSDSSNYTEFYFGSDDKLNFQNVVSGTQNTRFVTTQVFRDVSAWYHIVLSINGSSSAKVYVNGAEITAFDTFVGPGSSNHQVNNNVSHTLGAGVSGSSSANFYLADTHLIDGQALAPTDFGEFDADTGVWNPIAYTGTYGTNGFHLDFSDNSSNAALGNDSSGNNNDWTVNNLVADAPGLGTANAGFDVLTYTGNGSTQSITGLDFQPDFVWLKQRNTAKNHGLYDIVRGATKRLTSNGTNAEITDANLLTSFDSNGFSVGSDSEVNESSGTYVAWCWKAGGTASLNENGTIDSQVSANTTYGFSIVTFTGNASNATIGHGLNAAPSFYIVKARTSSGYTDFWSVYHESLGASAYIKLNDTAAASTGSTIWNSTAPTSSVFSVDSASIANVNNVNYVAYCWSEVSGFSKFGSYTGNNSSNGPVITTGFKPRWVMIKGADSGINDAWKIFDTARSSTGNPVNDFLSPNNSNAEVVNNTNQIDILDNGFQITSSPNTDSNYSGKTYIYAAFADKPDSSIIDSLIDTPTNYEASSGNNGGNYATLNPLAQANHTLTNGNLDVLCGSSDGVCQSTFGMSSGKWYCEWTSQGAPSEPYGNTNKSSIGLSKSGVNLTSYLGSDSNGWQYYSLNGNKNTNGTSTSYGSTYVSGDIIGVAFDADNGTLTFYKNNVSQGIAFTGLTDGPYFFSTGSSYVKGVFNFGQRPFAYTPPTGYKSLCTTNLPDPTIADGSTAMDVKLYSDAPSSVSGFSFSPDFVWLKRRSATANHGLYDIVRGANKLLYSDATNSEETAAGVSAFNSDGFDLGSNALFKGSGNTFVAWAWDGGTTTDTSNTAGSITPTGVRANQSAGFSIVTFTMGSGTFTVGHGLNAAPALLITKGRSFTSNWWVYHESLGSSQYLGLNSTSAAASLSWGGSPTSTVFTANNNFFANGQNYVVYAFAPVAGYSAFGSYTGNGSTDGPFVYTGFKPRWVMIKCSSAVFDWRIFDTSRSDASGANVVNYKLYPNTSTAENGSGGDNANTNNIDILSNGFKLRTANGATNDPQTYIYAAFAESPFKTARAR